jgi:hypothetical protein
MSRHTDAPVITDKHEERPHVSDIVLGLIEARVSGVDFFDTVGGAELERMYRHRQAHRRAAHRGDQVPSTADQRSGSFTRPG